jgi:hypothetical protein
LIEIKNNIFLIVKKKENNNSFDNKIDDRDNYIFNNAKIEFNFEINILSESNDDILSNENNDDILYAN